VRQPFAFVETGAKDIDAHGQHGHAVFDGKEAGAALERLHGANHGDLLGEMRRSSLLQHLANVLEAFAHAAALLGKGEGVAEETGAEAAQAVAEDVAGGGGDGHPLAEPLGHAAEEHRLVQVHVVVADDEDRLGQVAEVFAPADLHAVAERRERKTMPVIRAWRNQRTGASAARWGSGASLAWIALFHELAQFGDGRAGPTAVSST
jgi:hypothetical protein